MKKKFKLISSDPEHEFAYIHYVESPCKLTYSPQDGIKLNGTIEAFDA